MALAKLSWHPPVQRSQTTASNAAARPQRLAQTAKLDCTSRSFFHIWQQRPQRQWQ